MANRTDKGHFRKGESGNPAGRPRFPEELRERFQAKAPEALELLVKCLHSSDDRIAMTAANSILDRGYVKPTQSVDANVTSHSTFEQALDEVQARINKYKADER